MRTQAESFTSAASGVTIVNDDGGLAIGDFNSGRWIAFSALDLGKGIAGWRVRGGNTANGTLRLRLGSPTGIGTPRLGRPDACEGRDGGEGGLRALPHRPYSGFSSLNTVGRNSAIVGWMGSASRMA